LLNILEIDSFDVFIYDKDTNFSPDYQLFH